MAVAISEASLPTSRSLQWDWHRSAPRRIVNRYRMDDSPEGWASWQQHLARRKRPDAPPHLTSREPPLFWGLPNDWQIAIGKIALKSPLVLASVILDDDGMRPPDLRQSVQLLASAYALPGMARVASPGLWWQLTGRLHDIATEAQQHRVDWPADPADVVRQQLLAGELPLALGYLFPEIGALRALRKMARTNLSEAIIELSDGEGLPRAGLLSALGPLFACWTRARWLGQHLPRGCWSRKAEGQYRWLVRHAIRLADRRGRFVLAPADAAQPAWTEPLFSMALQLAGNERDCAAAQAAIGKHVVPKRMKFRKHRLPKPSLDSDWAGIAVMSDGWTRSSVRLAVGYADDPVRLELVARGHEWLAGAWTFETSCDGRPLHPVGEWENLFWSSDKYCDMLELGIKLSEGVRLERQLILGHRDQVLFLADVVISADGTPRRLKHCSHLPLCHNSQWQAEAETRDGVLIIGKQRVAVLPLALPEWRADPQGGNLQEEGGQLVLHQESTGRALYCPLLIDLNPKRARHERTWRQLTVAEWMEPVPRDVAVGFRAQSGRDQWLFYRSLGEAGNRTVLGHNIAGEFCAGTFQSSGKLEDWIEIEAE